jgi:HEAT repeat protein
MDSLFIRASTGEIKYLHLNKGARDTLVEMGGGAVPYLIDQLETKSARERHTLIAIFKEIKAPAVKPMIKYIESDPDRGPSRLAVHIMGKIGEEAGDAVPMLIKLAQHRLWRMRLASCEAMGEIGDPRGIDPLILALEDSVFLVRKGAAFGLGKMAETVIAMAPERQKQSLEALIRTLGDDSYVVRYPAAQALEKIGKPAIPHLINTLKEKDPLVRSMVCEVLGKIQDKKSLKPLKKMLKDDDWGVRVAARDAILSINKDEKIKESSESPIGNRIQNK